MVALLPSSVLLGLVASTSLVSAATTTASTSSFNWSNIKHVVAFGDSYSAIQGTYGYVNKTFLGAYNSGFSFSKTTLLNNQILQNFWSTAEQGPNWLQYLTGCAVVNGQYYPADCSIQLWDFAFAGASVSKEFLPTAHSYTIPLVNQTQRWLKWADPALAQTPVNLDRSKTLVTIWIGVNDVVQSKTLKPSSQTYEQFWTAEVNAVIEQSAKPLLAAGYKNFLFVNQPPLDRTAANQKASQPYPTKTLLDSWNSILATNVNTFRSSNSSVKAMLYNANTFLNALMDNASQYGIKNTTTYCPSYLNPDVVENPTKYGCLPQSQYFWNNANHLSSYVHKLMAQNVAKFLTSQSS